MAVRILLDLNIFELIAPGPQSLDELAKATGADARLLKRVLRMATSIRWLKQDVADQWQATPISQVATLPPFRAWLITHFDTRVQTYSEFPEWLRKHDFKTSWAGAEDNIWLQENKEPVWAYMASHPEYSALFDTAMSIQDNLPPDMIPPYPFADDEVATSVRDDEVAFVDIGGGFGQTIEFVKQNYPKLQGKFILQDLPKTIDVLDKSKVDAAGYEAQVHDFFGEQPVKGARYYNMRRVLHDWNDEKSVEILKANRPALDPKKSKLLIQDFVLPDKNAALFESQIDLMMMTSLDGQERSESDWRVLLEKAGFKIDRIHRAQVGTTSVIEASVA
ncbi:S-adenosyl-L-methionine-dependent methyltransferase [Sarocladium strictum]